MTTMTPTFEQEHYRIRSDANSANGGTPTWSSTEDQGTRTVINVDTNFRIRFTIANTGTGGSTPSFSVYYSRNGGAYTEVTASSTHVKVADASSDADGQQITTGNFLLTAGTGTGVAGQYDEDGAISLNLNNGNFTELEFGMTIDAAGVNDADTLDFRVYQNDTALNVYDVTALVEVQKAGPVLTAEAGSYTITGVSVNLEVDRKVIAEAGTYSISGEAASLERSRIMPLDAGSYSLSGSSVNLLLGRRVIAEAGTYALTGSSVDLLQTLESSSWNGAWGDSWNGAWGALPPVILVDAGTYTITGSSVNLTRGVPIHVDAGSYSIVGSDVSLEVGRRLLAEAGSYIIAGQEVALIRSSIAAAEQGSYNISGVDANLIHSREVMADGGSYAINGSSVELIHGTVGGAPGSGGWLRRRRR